VYEEDPTQDQGAGRIEDMAFITFEDETGLIETTWFPEAYRPYAVLIEPQQPLLLRGVVEVDHGVVTVVVKSAEIVASRKGQKERASGMELSFNSPNPSWNRTPGQYCAGMRSLLLAFLFGLVAPAVETGPVPVLSVYDGD